jgi:hypothetical protein
VPHDSRSTTGRAQRVLAYIAVALVGLSVISIVVMLVVTGVGLKLPAAAWAPVYLFPVIGLPIGALCIVALFIIGLLERRKLNTGAAK